MRLFAVLLSGYATPAQGVEAEAARVEEPKPQRDRGRPKLRSSATSKWRELQSRLSRTLDRIRQHGLVKKLIKWKKPIAKAAAFAAGAAAGAVIVTAAGTKVNARMENTRKVNAQKYWEAWLEAMATATLNQKEPRLELLPGVPACDNCSADVLTFAINSCEVVSEETLPKFFKNEVHSLSLSLIARSWNSGDSACLIWQLPVVPLDVLGGKITQFWKEESFRFRGENWAVTFNPNCPIVSKQFPIPRVGSPPLKLEAYDFESLNEAHPLRTTENQAAVRDPFAESDADAIQETLRVLDMVQREVRASQEEAREEARASLEEARSDLVRLLAPFVQADAPARLCRNYKSRQQGRLDEIFGFLRGQSLRTIGDIQSIIWHDRRANGFLPMMEKYPELATALVCSGKPLVVDGISYGSLREVVLGYLHPPPDGWMIVQEKSAIDMLQETNVLRNLESAIYGLESASG